jgi:hypothetical protein
MRDASSYLDQRSESSNANLIAGAPGATTVGVPFGCFR